MFQPGASDNEGYGPRTVSILFLIAAFAVAGCASYDGRPVPSEGAHGYLGAPVKRTANGVVVEADPYLRLERQVNIFDAELVEHQILGVYVTVRNLGARPVLIRRSGMALITADGIKFIPADAKLVAARVDPGPSVVWGFLFGLFGWIFNNTSEASAQNARVADYVAKQFRDISLGANEAAFGFVYFIAVESDPPFGDATLRVPVADRDGEAGFEIALPFGGGAP